MGMKSLEQYRVDFIDVIKRIIAANLANKGTTASATESLQALADKIASVYTGRREASGIAVASNGYITVTGLNFKPSIIVAGSNYANVSTYYKVLGEDYYIVNGNTYSWNTSPSYLIDGAFKMKIQGTSGNYYWIAFE